MSQIQGKQIVNNTIEQNKLKLITPTSGDTLSGATVQYVNSALTSGDFHIVLGPPEDNTYTDGIFVDLQNTTPIGIFADRVNEILLKLAPTPPTDFSNGTPFNISGTTYSMRNLNTGSIVSTVSTITTPTFTATIPTQGLSDALNGTLTFAIDASIQETYTIIGSNSKSSGVIRFTAGDPYIGQAGKAGFWSGFTAVSAISTTLTASSSQKTANYTHSTKGSLTRNFYIDSPLTPAISGLTATVPTMSRYISGIPSLASGNTISNINFNITNVASYFYALNYVWTISGTLIATQTGDPDNIPTSYGETCVVSNKTTTVNNNVYNDTTFTFIVTPRNSILTNGTIGTFTDSTKRIDTVSNESLRKTSGNGSYPSTGYNGTYDSTQSLVDTYTNEMMLKNGIYQYPSGNYTTYGGPNYSSATGTRWATFNLGTFNNNAAFTLNINGSSGISTINQANLLIEVKIEGATYWVDGDAAYSGVGNPGSTIDGVAAVVTGSSTPTVRRITFGSITYTGSIIVRIGITNNSINFTNLTASNIV